jgi:hypothetical protein
MRDECSLPARNRSGAFTSLPLETFARLYHLHSPAFV